MAESKSKQTPISNHFPTGFYTISYEAFTVRGFKNLKGMTPRITPNKIFTKNEIDESIQQLKKQGYKKVRKRELTNDLPRKCPRCHRNGSPSIGIGKKTYTLKENRMSDEEKTKLVINKLKYTHTTSPTTCHIGYVNGNQITLNMKLPIDALGYHRRIGVYPLK